MSTATTFIISPTSPDFNEVYKSETIQKNYDKDLIVSGEPKTFITEIPNIQEFQYKMLDSLIMFVYMIGIIEYQNLITKKISEYRFISRLGVDSGWVNDKSENVQRKK